MKIFVKICGLCTPEDVEAVADLKPDAMGFVFWPKSRRAVKAEDVADWTKGLPSSIQKVGVFVDSPLAEVARSIKRARLDVVQFHGHEPPEICELLPVKVWKAFSLEKTATDALDLYHVDAFLLDSYSAESPGGTGQVGDWGRARVFVKTCETPVLLAGGLTPDNVRVAIRKVKPWGVDVSSGVELRPGKKDIGKVLEFIRQCRKK
jgi:phosphoribosylanthranilate isomerase